MIQFRYEPDPAEMAYVTARLSAIPLKAPLVMARALNRTAIHSRKLLSDKARETYDVKAGGFKSDLKIKNATAGNLEAVLHTEGRALKLSKFGVRKGKEAVRARVLKSSGYKPLYKNGIKAFWTIGKSPLVVRQGKDRYPLKVLFSKTVPDMIGDEWRVYGVIEPTMQQELQKNMRQQISRILG